MVDAEQESHPRAKYSEQDLARRSPDDGKASTRWVFTRDRARVLHSWALRRLADKTQVLLPGDSDFPRTRLTHTLEVAQIAREMGAELGCDPDLTETAGLCHDLGHPPFGHNGEAALNKVAEHIGGFEGNAQSFRVLTRLESKVFDGEEPRGLNLSRASLDSAIKYPWPRRADTGKFNVYADDLPAFDWVRQGAVAGKRCLEAQVMDWADDVAYSVHDIEDALYSGFITPSQLGLGQAPDAVVAAAQQVYAPDLTEGDVQQAMVRLAAQVRWPSKFDSTARALAGLKQITSALISRFTNTAVAATRERYHQAPLNRYVGDLVVPADVRAEVVALKSLSHHFVFFREGSEERYAQQQRILTELVAALVAADGDYLAPLFTEAWAATTNAEERLRVIIDQVASLTDVSAVRWHGRLCGGAT